MKKAHDFQNFHTNYLNTHLQAYPNAKKYSYTAKPLSTSFSLTLASWNNLNIIFNKTSNTSTKMNSTDVAIRLYDVTEQMISNFENGKKHIYQKLHLSIESS
jgi:hypothetical protein